LFELKKFVKCEKIGRFVECVDFEEVEGEAWVIERLDGLSDERNSKRKRQFQ
jgi:hypothetical protein